jgi:hypothetical protein
MATDYALFEELGAVDKYIAMHVKVRKKMLPHLLGTAFKLFKMVSPERAIEQVIKRYAYTQQMYVPKRNIDIIWNPRGEVVCRIKCPNLSKLRDIVNKAGLDIDPRFHCGIELEVLKELTKEFGLDSTGEMKEYGCQFISTFG